MKGSKNYITCQMIAFLTILHKSGFKVYYIFYTNLSTHHFKNMLLSSVKTMARLLPYHVSDCELMEPTLARLPLLCEPPPTIPAALGTFLYPRNTDKLTPGRPGEEEYSEISRSRQAHEYNIFMCRKDKRWERIRDINGGRTSVGGKPYCSICSEAPSLVCPLLKVFFHTHVSSKMFRLESRLDQYGQYACHSCATTPHTCKQGIRYPVILTASALNNWQKYREENLYLGDEIHIDIIAIPGATLDVLLHALTVEYGGLNRPIDVLIVAGLNDVL